MRVALIACTKSKTYESYIPAKKLYWASNLFRLSYTYAKEVWRADKIYILSAKYGLIRDHEVVSYYEMTLTDLSKEKQKEWGVRILKQLREMDSQFLVLAGLNYQRPIDFAGLRAIFPGAGMSIGSKMSWLKQEIQRHRHPSLRSLSDG